MTLTLGNPLGGVATGAVGVNQFAIATAGKSLSTGKTANNDVVSDFLGKGLNDKQFILSKINNNMGYSKNALNVASSSLDTIAKTLADMLAVVAQATSDTNIDTLNDILQQKLKQVELQTNSATFDNRKLLTGDLGQDSTVRSSFNKFGVQVKTIPAPAAGNDLFLGAGTKGVKNLTITGNTAAGDTVTVGTVQFTAVAGEPANENQFKVVAGSINETAKNLATAIKNHSNEALQAEIDVTVAAADVSLTQTSASASGGNVVVSSANITLTHSTPGVSGGIDVSHINDIAGFIGSQAPIFTVEHWEASANAKQIARNYGSLKEASDPAAVAGNDEVAVFSTVIGGKKFMGAHFNRNGANLFDAQLKMTNDETQEYFVIKGDTAYAGVTDSLVNSQAIATSLNTLFAGTTFTQSKTLQINTDSGDILVGSTVVGSTKGTTVKLTATDFTNLQFKDFKIEPGLAAGDVKLTAVITDKNGVDQNYSVNRTAGAEIAAMIQGFKLDLTDSTGNTGNVLSINLGVHGLTNLDKAANYAAVAQAYKDMLLSTGDGIEVRVGLNFEDVLRASIKDVSATKLYLDNSKTYRANLKLTTDADRKLAQEVISNALAKIRSEQSRVTSQIESIQEASDALARTIQVTKEASDGYLNTDLIDAAQAFSEAVKKTIAAISTLEAGNKVSDAAQRVIQSIA